MGLLAAGIYLENRPARIAAVALIAVTTFKCFLYDLARSRDFTGWRRSSGWHFAGAGVAGAAEIRARQAEERHMKRQPPIDRSIVAGLIQTLALVRPRRRTNRPSPRYTRDRPRAPGRSVSRSTRPAGKGAPFPWVSAEGYEGGRLADLRLFEPTARKCPTCSSTVDAAVVAGAVFRCRVEEDEWIRGDLGSSRRRSDQAGRPAGAPHVKRVKVEGSGDRERWTARGGRDLFDLPDRGASARTRWRSRPAGTAI